MNNLEVVCPALAVAALALGYFEHHALTKWRITETMHLTAQIDQELVQSINELRMSRRRGQYKPGDAWRALGGLRGLPHVISQGYLLTDLVFGLHAQYPELFTYEVDQVRGARFCLLLGSLGAIKEAIRAHWHPNHQRQCTIFLAEAFCDLAAEVRCALEVYGSLGVS
jgi:hypothetical protein